MKSNDDHHITNKPIFCLVQLPTMSPDSNDDNHSDSELDDMMHLVIMSGITVKNDDDDVEEVNVGEWNMVHDYKTILVEVDGVNQHLLAIAREEVHYPLSFLSV